MSLRLIELVLPEGYRNVLEDVLNRVDILDYWEETLENSRLSMKILVLTENTEDILDLMEKRFSHMQGFRIILLPVEASLPRPKKEEKVRLSNQNQICIAGVPSGSF